MEQKTFLLTLVALVVGSLPFSTAWAQAFKPTRPIEVVVHATPGGGSDVLARAIAEINEKEKLVPQRMQVLNNSGGGSAVANAYLVEKKGDTHTIGLTTNTFIVTALIRKEAKYTVKDLTPVARLLFDPTVAVVKADSTYKSMKDFIEEAKKHPGKLTQSGGTVTAIDSLYRIFLQKAAGAKWNFISFTGGERISNLLGGNAHLLIQEIQEVGEHIRAGSLRVITTFTEKRLPAFPDVPTIREEGFNIPDLNQARAVVAPPGIPKEVVEFWEDFFARLLKTPSWKKFSEQNQFVDSYLKSSELAAFFDEQNKVLRSALQEAGVKLAR
jgi:putative tricarboxylic transport membrane protein